MCVKFSRGKSHLRWSSHAQPWAVRPHLPSLQAVRTRLSHTAQNCSPANTPANIEHMTDRFIQSCVLSHIAAWPSGSGAVERYVPKARHQVDRQASDSRGGHKIRFHVQGSYVLYVYVMELLRRANIVTHALLHSCVSMDRSIDLRPNECCPTAYEPPEDGEDHDSSHQEN